MTTMAKATSAPDTASKAKPKADSGKMAKSGSKSSPKGKAPAAPWYMAPVNYVKDVRTEMRRVVWPSRQEVLNSSVVVVITLLFFVVFTFVIDQGVIYFLRAVTALGNAIGA
jgi:preprotein translocase subunit SecE